MSNKIYQFGEKEEKIDELVSEQLIKPMFSEESKRKNRNFGIKCFLITVFFILLGIILIVWSINSSNYTVIKVIGAVLCLIVGFIIGIVTHALLVPPKNVNGFGNFDKN